MKFAYTEYTLENERVIRRPTLPITLRYGNVTIPVADALVDTGADQTVLPLEFATAFGFSFDLKKDVEKWSGAGGSLFLVYRSPKPIHCSLSQIGFRTIQWEGHVYFTLKQPTILLGHKGCLEHLDLVFRGKQRMLEVAAAR